MNILLCNGQGTAESFSRYDLGKHRRRKADENILGMYGLQYNRGWFTRTFTEKVQEIYVPE